MAQVLSSSSWLLAYGSYAVVALLASVAVLVIPIETMGRAPPEDIPELIARVQVRADIIGHARINM